MKTYIDTSHRHAIQWTGKNVQEVINFIERFRLPITRVTIDDSHILMVDRLNHPYVIIHPTNYIVNNERIVYTDDEFLDTFKEAAR